jgi:hypothetical protein
MDGNILIEKYYIEGKLHKEDGPAWIEYNSCSKISCIYFYIKGKKVDSLSNPLSNEWYRF